MLKASQTDIQQTQIPLPLALYAFVATQLVGFTTPPENGVLS